MYALYLKRPEEDVRFPGTTVRDDWETPYRCWEPNMGPKRAASSLNC